MRIKTGVNQWAFPEVLSPSACFKLAKEAGFETAEVTIAEEDAIARIVLICPIFVGTII